MTVDELLERARSQIGLGTVYRMGGGKIVPFGADCRDELGGCDCSAFVCWALRIRKYQGGEFWWLAELNDGWLNTDGIWLDARGDGMMPKPASPLTTGNFTQISEPSPGCIVVYPAEHIARVPGSKAGHAGIVTQVQDVTRWQVIHCSLGNYRLSRDAIQETDPEVFLRNRSTLFAWPASVKP